VQKKLFLKYKKSLTLQEIFNLDILTENSCEKRLHYGKSQIVFLIHNTRWCRELHIRITVFLIEEKISLSSS
jgi:hypothetical protein